MGKDSKAVAVGLPAAVRTRCRYVAPSSKPHAGIGYAAFTTHYQPRYLHYARVRTGSGHVARWVVESVLDELAKTWEQALSSASLIAYAWRLLSLQAGQAAIEGAAGGLYGALPQRQADALLLRYRLGLSPPEITALTGREAWAVAGDARAGLQRLTTRTGYPHP